MRHLCGWRPALVRRRRFVCVDPSPSFPPRLPEAALGVTLEFDTKVTDIRASMATGKFDAAFLAVGAHVAKRAYLPAGSAARVLDALSVLRSMDGTDKPLLGRRVVVYGGGNTAVDVARSAKRLGADDFPKTNWQLRKWLWLPLIRAFGLFKITLFRHVATLSGVGVGGGSLVYANTLPVPKRGFFNSPSWSHLADWETELKPFYAKALHMLGATPAPRSAVGDQALLTLAQELGKQDHFERTNVAVYFGEPGKTVADPYFDGQGPDRTGCVFCGGCMLGCRFNAKNTLDKNYLHLAQGLGAVIKAESLVTDVRPLDGGDGSEGYRIAWKSSTKVFGEAGSYRTRGVVFAAGVLGTVRLLLDLKRSSLPALSDRIGESIRTNSESLIGITALDKKTEFSKGVAISSILHTDEHSHLEPVRYSSGSGFWRLFMAPLVSGGNLFVRLGKTGYEILRRPIVNIKMFTVDDWSRRTQILLFMQTLNNTLRFTRGLFGMKSKLNGGERPTAFIPEANRLAKRYSRIVGGNPAVLLSETVFGIPTTAHILGGAAMGKDADSGVIDKNNRVFGYRNMFVCDGSMISANVGVNPSLTITAISERAMSGIPARTRSEIREDEPVAV